MKKEAFEPRAVLAASVFTVLVFSALAFTGCATPPPAPPAPSGPQLILDDAQTYIVVQGDTMAQISAGQYGRQNMYYFPLIHIASKDVNNNPDEIEIGDRLTVPNLQKNLADPGAAGILREGLLAIADQYARQRKASAAAILRRLAAGL